MSQRRLPAEIYWRRRLLVLAALIALVWAGMQVFAGGEEQPTAKPTPSQTPSAPEVTPTAAPTTRATPKGQVDVALTGSDEPCDPEEIRLVPTVESGQLTLGSVKIGLAVSTTSGRACTLTPKKAETIAVISQGSKTVWDSTVCKDSVLTETVQIAADWATQTTLNWHSRTSGSKCGVGEQYAGAGEYTLQIGTLGGEPGKTTFTLAARPQAPKPKPKPTKKADAKKSSKDSKEREPKPRSTMPTAPSPGD